MFCQILFKEGKGVVAQGKVGADGMFVASEVLAKHDENYMPPEAAEALKRAQATGWNYANACQVSIAVASQAPTLFKINID